MGKIYRTVDLLKKAYDGEIFKNKFRNIITNNIIKQGEGNWFDTFFYENKINSIGSLASEWQIKHDTNPKDKKIHQAVYSRLVDERERRKKVIK